MSGPLTDATISGIHPEPGDTVIVTVPKPMRQEFLEGIGDQLKRSFPDNRVVVMEEGTSLSVEDDQLRTTVDDLASEFERRSKEAHDRRPDSVPSLARDNAVWASYRDAAYLLRQTFDVPYEEKTDDQLEEGAR